MPLVHGKSKKAFKENVSTEMDAGKPKAQSLAIAYAMKKKAKKMAHGGVIENLPPHKDEPLPEDYYAEGGEVGEQSETRESDMIDRIMMKRMPSDEPVYMSKGGMVANELGEPADALPNEFDDLALRDDLEFSYNGENSGDEHGSKLNQDDHEDMIGRIMSKRMRK